MACAIEVLEHVPDPAHTVAEMARVAQTPPARLGAARAAVADAEHGPGRVPVGSRQHAGARQPLVEALVRAAARRSTARSSRSGRRSPGRCCLSGSAASADGRRRGGAAQPAIGSGRSYGVGRADPDDRDRLDRRLHVPLPRAREPLSSAAPPTAASSLLWSVMFVILSVIYRPIEQLLSRTIADRRARGLEGHPLRVPATIQLELRAAVPGRRARAAAADRGRTCSTARARSTGCSSSACSPTPAATSRAAGSPGTSASACTAGSCSSSRPRACCSRSRPRSGSRSGQSAIAIGHGGGAVRLAGGRAVRARARAADGAPAARGGARGAGARRGRRGPGARRDRGGRRRPVDRPRHALRGRPCSRSCSPSRR